MSYVIQRLAVIIAVLLVGAETRAASDDLAWSFRPYVVRITASWPDGSTQNGFGFIVGEQRENLIVATANHVVRDEDKDLEPAERVRIKFFTDQGRSVEATVLETSEPKLDLAVLEVPRPEGLPWPLDSSLSATSKTRRGTSVWYVGRGDKWDVPPKPGIVSEVDELNYVINVQDLGVLPGTSGAPLFTDCGIVGMIVRDEAGDLTSVTPIGAIETAITQWKMPWHLGTQSMPSQEDVVFRAGVIEMTGTAQDFDEFSGAATAHSPTYVVGKSDLNRMRHYIGYSYGDPLGGNKAQFLQFNNLVVGKQYTFYVQPSSMSGDGNCFYATAERGAVIVEGGCKGWLGNPVNRRQDAWKVVFNATCTSTTIRLGNNYDANNSNNVSRYIYIDAIFSERR